MAVDIVFETHAISADNEAGLATGWHPGRLSVSGQAAARELGHRRRDDGLAVVFTSDLARALETVELAFGDSDLPVLCDWRLRECDYGQLTRHPVEVVHGRRADYLDRPYPGGESWRQAIARVAGVLDDLLTRWGGQRCCWWGMSPPAGRWNTTFAACPSSGWWSRSSSGSRAGPTGSPADRPRGRAPCGAAVVPTVGLKAPTLPCSTSTRRAQLLSA